MENETKKSKLTAKDILAKTGPGIIMAAAAVGTGTVSKYISRRKSSLSI